MDMKPVVKLVKLMEAHSLEEVEVEQGDIHIRLKKGSSTPVATSVIATPVQIVAAVNGNPGAAAPSHAEALAQGKDAAEKEGTIEVTAPMVGTFYRSSSPDTDHFVSEGDPVEPDTVICIIEAMKVMNEIKAEAEGEVVRFLVENGESVEYGQPIMVIRPTNPTP